MADQKTSTFSRLRKSPSPLLLSPKAMEFTLAKERMRCDRHGHFFSLLVLQLPYDISRIQLQLLAKILHRRLRITDEKGMLLKGGIGVLLPMTDIHGAKVVMNAISHSALRNGIDIDAEIFTYSGSDNFAPPRVTESDSNTMFENESSQDETNTETSHQQFPSSTTTLPVLMKKFIRADDKSQNRSAAAGELVSTSTLTSTHLCPRYPKWKRGMDICCASIGLLISMPIIVLSAIAIKTTSKGPVFFRQMRSGQFGNAFPVYKLRTMVVDAEELKETLQVLNERDGPAFKMKNDPRVTRVGGILRKTGLDELPQLWNVLVGHMAIVGPRPLPCNEDAKCEIWQRRRLDTKPGLTCVWQISKSRRISFADWMRMDLRYADRRTIGGDISLMFKTVKAVFLGRVGH